ncbi:MAG: murein biosynthesis integral membrane protein MurJ, partial [Aestuariivirgaceae bacterium]|nr:murein biosynthesis integral membrane protein MurJ [Aestuariivirgaceae bacterium]
MSLAKSVATVGGFTMISRVLGFIRDQLVAFALGTGPVSQAFVIAQRFPNLFRALFAEGAFNAAFVPQFARRIEGEGEVAAHQFAQEVFAVLTAWLLLFSTLAIIFMPALIYVIAPGFAGEGEKFDLAVALTRICFPYLLFMSLTALQSGVLNAMSRFTAAAAAPILLNLVMIASNGVVWFLGTGDSAATGYIFAFGILASGIAQYALLAVACKRAGMPLVPKMPKLTPGVKKVLWLSVPGILSGGIVQINLVFGQMIATTIDRAVSYLYFADRLFQLPLGVIGVAIGVVLLPDLSRKLRAGETEQALNVQNRALELSLFLTLPAAVALFFMGAPIFHTLFEHGAFRREDTLAVAPALAAYALGLPAFSMIKVFQPGFYAREDTRTPMIFAIVSVIINLTASLTLSRVIGHVGIAAAVAIAAWVNAAQLGLTLNRRGFYSPDPRLKSRLPRILAASVIMGAALWAMLQLAGPAYAPGTGFGLRAAV